MHPKYIQLSFILMMTLKLTTSEETNAPVYEVINEQARTDDKIRLSNNPGLLPYGNPLAGNSKQNARIHISNQQAMFNAERVRQHKAQLQRWNQGPKDSYMKAYHDLQENHQLELEQQQATLNDSPVTSPRPTRTRQRDQNIKVQSNENPTEKQTNSNRLQSQRKQLPRRGPQRIDPVKQSKTDTNKSSRNRNHRSYGSINYNQQLEPKGYNTVYISQESIYQQGISIKPNGNIGFKQQIKESPELYTDALPSGTKSTLPHIDHKFTSVQEIEALNSLLAKNSEQQLSEFTTLINSGNNDELNKDVPIDFYFYLKNPAQQNVDKSKYTTYANAYVPVIKDHTPITEEVDDIEDPGIKQLMNQPQPTDAPKIETATTKSNNYVDVASQIISDQKKPFLHYGYHNRDKIERYLHHNTETTGVQHLLEDGTQTSAFDDNLHYAANYEFGYRVDDHNSGNYYGHRESKKGKSTKGQYHVLLPDGRMQQVKYSAGPDGYHADISYELQ